MDVNQEFYEAVENACRDLYIQSLKEIPPDVVAALRQAAKRETTEVGRRIFSHYLQSIELGRTKDMLVCQDTGIPIYWVEIGGNLRLDGAQLSKAIVKGNGAGHAGTSIAFEHCFAVGPRENRQTSTGEGIPIIHYDFMWLIPMSWTFCSCPKVPVRRTCRL